MTTPYKPEHAITSEMIEPTFALIIGRMFARCEAAKGGDRFVDACYSLWFAIDALNSLAIPCDATHCTLAMNNHTVQIAQYICEETGEDPFDWKV